MSQETSIQSIEELVNQLLEEHKDIFLVSIKIKPTNNIKIFLDADEGLSIDKCVKINRRLYRHMEENQWYPDGNFSLEVSSPGIDEPLKLTRQYKKNIGRKVEVITNDDVAIEGKLMEVNETSLIVEQLIGKNKKAVTTNKEILFSDLKQIKVLIAF